MIDYCLSPDHPRGKHKARVFKSACGLGVEDAELLRQQLLEAAELGEATAGPSVGYGERFVIEWNIQGPLESAAVRSAWIVRQGEDFPRFVSGYVVQGTISMNEPIELLDVVALVQALHEHHLVRGQVGTVVERLESGVYEVEFSDDEGRTYAMLPLSAEQLIVLHTAPVRTA